jgi:mono/diheme cytochrome c family protein
MRVRSPLLILLAPGVLLPLFALASRPPATTAAEKATFAKEGVAFLQKNCIGCHGEKTKKADVTLHTLRTDADLVKHRKLMKDVLQLVHAGEMPPSGRPRPAQDDIDGFLAIVKEVFAVADKNAKPDPGRVTVRRLNRVEYDNTIRDLVGIDFQPSEDFPSDDIGHGFDNIGDVLTLSPVLMERYLAAADSIMTRAIPATAPKPTDRWMSSRYLEPATPKEYKWRPLDKRGNELNTPYKISLAGEYTFHVRAYAKLPDKEPAKVVVLLGKKEVKRFEVSAPEAKPIRLEVKLDMPLGDQRVHLKLLNPTDGDNGRNVFVENFHLNGPSDTRPLTQRKLVDATPGKSKPEQAREILSRFATKAYRRPATEAEVHRLVKLAESAQKRGDSWEASLQLALQAVLVSPKFLFRVEADDRPSQDKPYPIDDYQLASRLSYFLWSTMPDEELFALAAKKQLSASLDAQIKRMLKDPKASALVDNFAMQWLQLRRLETHSPDPKLFPTFNATLRNAMIQETKLFFGEIVREDRPVLDLIDADYTYINAPLSNHYGIRDTAGNYWGQKEPMKPGGKSFRNREFVRVPLLGTMRGGLLTQASILTVTSNPTRTSPVKRGKWVLEQLLGTPPPPPPPDVPELDEKKLLTGSLRQQMEQHRKNPACASCHAKMDPLGFAFENYDAIGKYRWQDGKFPIDPSGTLPGGKSFSGAAELKAILKGKKELVARCLAEKMLTYALGRGLEHYDAPAVDAVVAGLAKNDYRFSALVTEISKSLPFRMRRGKELTP